MYNEIKQYHIEFMKKYAILFLSTIFLISCASQEKKLTETSCPDLFISKEHKDYFSIDKDNISEDMAYIATINNFKLKCKKTERKAIFSVLDILFVVKPLKKEVKGYDYHYFVSILDNNNEILDYQIFSVKGEFSLDKDNNLSESVVTESLDQFIPSQYNLYKIIIGFVLDEEKYNFINN